MTKRTIGGELGLGLLGAGLLAGRHANKKSVGSPSAAAGGLQNGVDDE